MIGEKLALGSELQFQSAMHTLAGSQTNSFWLGNLTLSSRWPAKGVELAAGLYNVLDERYENIGAEEHLQDVIEQDGRTYRLKVTKQFGTP